MKRKALALTLISALLFSVVAGGLFVDVGKANFTPLPELPPPIYMRSDGGVDPSIAPIQRVGDTYKFTNDINNTIEVQRANVVVDGNGFALTKPAVNTEGLMTPVGWLPGIRVVGGSNITIRKIKFENCVTGVTVENSSDITVSENKIAAAASGVVILSSSNINIIDNNIKLSNQDFATGINLLPSNSEASNPYHIRIEGNIITGAGNVSLASPPPQPQQYGVWGDFSYSELRGNDLSGIKGIALYFTGSSNLMVGNNFQNNQEGIFFTGEASSSVDNCICFNNFNNSENAVIPFICNQPFNFWDNGTVGNYWSDYNGTDANGDGIGDSPYIIETVYYDYDLSKNVTVQEGEDNFPLMAPMGVPNPSPSPSPSSSPQETEPQPETEPFPTTLVIASVASAAVIGIGLLVYFKKRGRGSNP
jgi:parallel beta-helix repeat protein